jgi:hypothetical protein
MKVYKASIVKDGKENILFDDEITLSTNAGDGDKTDESSASLSIPVQAMHETKIVTKQCKQRSKNVAFLVCRWSAE